MSFTDKGKCQVCEREYQLTLAGVVRMHRAPDAPPPGFSFRPPCPGSRQVPLGSTETRDQ